MRDNTLKRLLNRKATGVTEFMASKDYVYVEGVIPILLVSKGLES